jgi:hypothetical protein
VFGALDKFVKSHDNLTITLIVPEFGRLQEEKGNLFLRDGWSQ